MSTASQPSGDSGTAFAARTPWSPGAAVAFVLISVATASLTAVATGTLYFQLSKWLVGNGSVFASDHITMANTMLAMIVMQTVMIAMVWWGAARFGGNRRQLLSLPSRLPVQAFLVGLAGMALLLAPFNLAMYVLWPSEFARDLRPFSDLARSPVAWLGALVVIIGAPLSEELLFRGFLLPALTRTRYGFKGAAVLTTLGWTALHIGYSITGLIEITMVGLYFCWLMSRYRNLWLPIALHGLYNGLQLALLALLPSGLG